MIQTQKIEKSDKEEIVSEVVTAVSGMLSEQLAEQTNFIVHVIEKKIDALAEATANGFTEVHARIDGLELRIDRMDVKIDDLGKDLDGKIDLLSKNLNGKIDKIDAKMTKNFVQVHQEIFRMKIANDLE